jgi:hypothetical protein
MQSWIRCTKEIQYYGSRLSTSSEITERVRMRKGKDVFKVVDGLNQAKLDAIGDYASKPNVRLLDKEVKMSTIAMDDIMEIGCLIYFHFFEEEGPPAPL